jgi:hypothetical protein
VIDNLAFTTLSFGESFLFFLEFYPGLGRTQVAFIFYNVFMDVTAPYKYYPTGPAT